MSSWNVLHEDATLRLWKSRQLVVAAWFDAPNADQMRKLARAGEDASRASEGGAGLANLIVSGVPRFSDDVRSEGIRIGKQHIFRRGSCHVVLVDGLAGAAVRAFMSMVLLVGTRSIGKDAARAKVFGDVDRAASWFSSELGEPWSRGEMSRLFTAAIAPRVTVD